MAQMQPRDLTAMFEHISGSAAYREVRGTMGGCPGWAGGKGLTATFKHISESAANREVRCTMCRASGSVGARPRQQWAGLRRGLMHESNLSAWGGLDRQGVAGMGRGSLAGGADHLPALDCC